jgi:hypothetical protein
MYYNRKGTLLLALFATKLEGGPRPFLYCRGVVRVRRFKNLRA